ncbi:MAG: hypothetical protein JRJ19_10110 [Deltaproteobacteria bacterium]|nr:hypothetical protein [Deltaproteobacteria bacterium]MBW1872409.1 hypothetical protein [Deltaproteobacteria bacterium]
MPFPYYQRLTANQKAIYRLSDKVSEIRLNNVRKLQSFAADLDQALQSERRIEVQQAVNRLCRQICKDLKVEKVNVKVLLKRPSDAEGELHGLFVREEGETAQLTVWMRTAKQKKVVAFKTFLRTLLHELCHHLDYSLLNLADTFHTEGFFRRESSLTEQLVFKDTKNASKPPPVDDVPVQKPQTVLGKKKRKALQMELQIGVLATRK